MRRASALALLLPFATAAAAQQAQLPFEPVQGALFAMPGTLANAWADYDRDGDLDLALVGQSGAVSLYRNDRGSFVSVGETVGLPLSGPEMRSASWGDYDGDGWPDLLVGPTDKEHSSRLFRNASGRRFTDVTTETGLAIPGRSARHTNWIDFDNDGDVDLYATDRAGENRLYRNDGGRFVLVPSDRAPADTRPTVGACWLDYDRDGDLDLFTANQAGSTDGLWRNDDDRFVDVAAALGMDNAGRTKDEGGVGCAVGDYDNDGYLDLFVPNYGRNALYRGGPGGSFTNVAMQAGVGIDNHAVGAAFGDYDNDGWPDLMVTSYVRVGSDLRPRDALFRNDGGAFVDLLADGGSVNVADHGVQWVDYDRDGTLDLSLTDSFGKEGGHILFRNTISGDAARRSLSVLVLDARGRYTRAGAEVRLYDATGRILGTRQVETAGGYSSQSMGPVHFGLKTPDPVTVEVSFMAKGGRRTVKIGSIHPQAYAGRSLVVRQPAK